MTEPMIGHDVVKQANDSSIFNTNAAAATAAIVGGVSAKGRTMPPRIDYLFRLLTDRRVSCQKCGGFIGYVWIFGHKHWEHVECPPYIPVKAVEEPLLRLAFGSGGFHGS